MNRAWMILLLVALTAAGAAEPKLSPRRKELIAAVEEYHTLLRKRERGGPTEHELEQIKHALRRAHERVQFLKRTIFKEERQKNDYYEEDPYPEHRKDPETGSTYSGEY